MSITAEASAKNSLFLDIANCMIVAIIGEIIISTKPIIANNPAFLLSSLSPLPQKAFLKIISETIESKPTKTTTALMSKMSLFPI